MCSPRNFIVIYNSREGSTAIVNQLSGQQGVNVPIMEELDEMPFKRAQYDADIHSALSEVFEQGQFSELKARDCNLQPVENPKPAKSIGFKWRPHGNPARLIPLLKKNRVTLFILSRRNFRDLVCSTYVEIFRNEIQCTVDIPSHPQFQTVRLSAEEREEFLGKINSARYSLDEHKFLHAARMRVSSKFNQSILAICMRAAGVPVEPIYYEDFCENPEQFIGNILRKLDHSESTPINTKNEFSRVNTTPLASRIDGLERVLSSARYRLMSKLYQFFMARI